MTLGACAGRVTTAAWEPRSPWREALLEALLEGLLEGGTVSSESGAWRGLATSSKPHVRPSVPAFPQLMNADQS